MSSLVSSFGESNIGGALANSFLSSLGSALKDVIDNAPLPQFLKDMAKGVIDNVVGSAQQETTPGPQDAVNDSYGDMLCNMSQGIAEEAGEEANNSSEGGANWLVALSVG